MAPPAQYTAWIRLESDRFYTVAEGADPEAPVPSCPGWTVADLVWHLGAVQWFWATVVELLATDPEAVDAGKPDRPATYADTVAFGRAQADHLVAVLDTADDDASVWTWSPPHQTVGFIRRHQVQEAAVHRWDIETAAGLDPTPMDAEAAADAIDEVLAVTLPWGASPERPLGGTTHLHCTDVDGEWFVDTDGSVEPVHAKGDVAVRGDAWVILLVLFGRCDASAAEVIGDAGVAADFLGRIRTD